jgi:SP family general alpha glucoside:H+ symporter-like MFS transporter
MINGYLCSRFGYRWVMIGALVVLNGLIFIVVFAPSLAVLVVGQILCGLPWGVFAIVGPTYASEVCPTNLRAYLATYVNLCWTIGQFIAAGVLEGFIRRQDEWAFRIPFALQWALPLPLIVICYFAPESPWYLVRKDRLDDAKTSLRRLAGNKTNAQINGQLAMLVHTAKIEAQLERGTTYWDCFKGVDLRRTEIICVSFLGQILSGSSFAYQPTYFFTTAGMSSDRAYQLNLGGTAVAFVGTALSWWLISNMGRRTIYLMGQAVLCTTLFLIGILNASSKAPGSLWAQSAFCIFWLFFYSFTIGPVAWAIMSETSSVRLRPLSVSLGRTSYQLANVVSQILEPYFMSPLAWNASGKTGFFWGGTALIMFIWAFFRLPEPRGRTYEELDILFAKKVPARKFASAHVDAYAQGEDQVAVKEKQ